MIVMKYMIHGSYAAEILFSTTPQSRNVSAGTMVNFTCAAPASGLTSISISATPPVGSSVTGDNILPNGDRQATLSFIAPSDQTSINIVCVALTATDFKQSKAVLMIQGLLSAVGNLTSTEVDHCTLNFTWTAPYTLQGVPINYYTINITRHSDGAVLRSDTTNTTEYLYSVSSLGETLQVVVAAVNGVGTGNATSIMTQSPSSIMDIEFTSILKNTIRTGSGTNTNWTYTFEFEETLVCRSAISHITARACLNSFCSITSEIVTMLSNGVRIVMATFTDLTENRHNYSATLNVNYNGGVVVQQSQPVDNISTFDVRYAILIEVDIGRVCLVVTYVEGHVQPARSFILFRCSTTGTNMHNGTIDQNVNCMEVDPHPSYNIIVTDNDDDAEEVINGVNGATAPVIIIGVSVPASATLSSSNTATTSPTSNDSDTIVIVPIVVGLVVASAMMIMVMLMVIVFTLLYCKNLKKGHHADNKIKSSDHVIELDSSNYHPSEVQQSNYEDEQRTQEDNTIYTDVGTHSQEAPRPALPTDDVMCSEGLISIGQKQCLERLAKMKTSQLIVNNSILFWLLQPLALVWYQFGEDLYLAPYLDDIQTNYSSDEERLQAVLVCWENSLMRPYTWKTLDEVLRSNKIGATKLANELKKKTSAASTLL